MLLFRDLIMDAYMDNLAFQLALPGPILMRRGNRKFFSAYFLINMTGRVTIILIVFCLWDFFKGEEEIYTSRKVSKAFLRLFKTHQISSVQFSCSVVSDSLRPHIRPSKTWLIPLFCHQQNASSCLFWETWCLLGPVSSSPEMPGGSTSLCIRSSTHPNVPLVISVCL